MVVPLLNGNKQTVSIEPVENNRQHIKEANQRMEHLHRNPHHIAPPTHHKRFQHLAKRVEDVVVVIRTALGVEHLQADEIVVALLGVSAVVVV